MSISIQLTPLPEGLLFLTQPSSDVVTAATLIVRHFRCDVIPLNAPSGTWVLAENAPFKDAIKNASVVRWSLGAEWVTTRISMGIPIKRLNSTQFPPRTESVRPITLEWNHHCLSMGWIQTDLLVGRQAIQQQLLNSLQRTHPLAWTLFGVRPEPEEPEPADVLDRS